MSKAFTKENDGSDEEPENDVGFALPHGVKNYITPHGAEKLRTELRTLLNSERPKLVETISWAAGNGDRSENGDYIYGKKRLREIDRRIRFLTKRLEIAEVVDPEKQSGDLVLFGATVTYSDEEGAQRKIYIVGIDEADASRGKVSWISPIAKAFLQGRKGDVIVFRSPKGEEELEILEVSYEGIPA